MLQGERDTAREAYIKLFAAHDATLLDLAKLQAAVEGKPLEVPAPRRKMPDERRGFTWHCRIGDKKQGVSPHIQINCFDDGVVGEVWIELDDKDKAKVGAAHDAAATAFSIALQHHAPLDILSGKWMGLHGGVHGVVWVLDEEPEEMDYEAERAHKLKLRRDVEVWACLSLLDAIARKLLVRYCGHYPFSPEGLHWEKVGDEGAWRWKPTD